LFAVSSVRETAGALRLEPFLGKSLALRARMKHTATTVAAAFILN